MKKDGLVMLISGTGGAGKNTLIQGLLGNDDFKFISSYTTRERREGDAKNQYQYISVAEFENKLKTGEIFEYDLFNDNYYGTSKNLFFDGLDEAKVVLKDISVMGYKNIVEKLGDNLEIVAVFLTERKSVLKQRLINRGEKPERIKNRLKLYKKEQSQIPYYNYCIKNDVYLNSLDKLFAISEIGLNKKMLLPTKEYTNLSAKKIDKLASKLENGKLLKPIKVALFNGEVYIISGIHRYLASLKTGKNVVKKFVDEVPKNTKTNLEEWQKIVKAYKI